MTFGSGASAYSYVLVIGSVLLPVNNVTNVAIGAPVDAEFAARNEVTLEVGKSLNLTALLTATGALPAENREVTWQPAKLNENVAITEFTARIKVTVTAQKSLAAPTLNVNYSGIRGWNEDPVAGDVYLGFTSDIHFDRNATAGENMFRLWMENLSKRSIKLNT